MQGQGGNAKAGGCLASSQLCNIFSCRIFSGGECERRSDRLHELQLLDLLKPYTLQQITRINYRQQPQVINAHDAFVLEGGGQRSTRRVDTDLERCEGVCERLQLRVYDDGVEGCI